MIHIYRVSTSKAAPKAHFLDCDDIGVFEGSTKSILSPSSSFEVAIEGGMIDRHFIDLAPGILVAPEVVLNGCEEMYYATDGVERLSMLAGEVPLIALNPTGFAPHSLTGRAPCAVDRFYAPIFRIQSLPPTDLFCIEGFGVPLDEFKFVYDRHRFLGLEFQEIWRGTADA